MPPSPHELQCLVILQAAASATLGLVITTNNPFKARAALYDARKGDPSLASLHIRVSPNDSEHELWIIKRDANPGFSMESLI